MFVFKSLSNYPEAILHLRKHLGPGAAVGTLRRSLTRTYGGRWGGKTEGRRLTSPTKACCFPSHWLEHGICWSVVLSTVWMHPWGFDVIWRWWNVTLFDIKEDSSRGPESGCISHSPEISSKWEQQLIPVHPGSCALTVLSHSVVIAPQWGTSYLCCFLLNRKLKLRSAQGQPDGQR